MRGPRKLVVLSVALAATVVIGVVPGNADHGTRPNTHNITAVADADNVQPPSLTSGVSKVNTDMGFWGTYAVQGSWWGFRIIDIADPTNPFVIYHYDNCDTGQGDIAVYGHLVFRAWQGGANSSRRCGNDMDPESPTFGERLPLDTGFQGVHVFDISDVLAKRDAPETIVETDVVLKASVPVNGGAHTLTLVDDPEYVAENNAVIVYGNPSSGTAGNRSFWPIKVPLDDPTLAENLGQRDFIRSCHDMTVFIGFNKKRIACSGSATTHGYAYLSADEEDGGSWENPVLLYQKSIAGTSTIGHTSSFTRDGKILLWSHEPGGGTGASCQITQSEVNRQIFFIQAETGKILGTWETPPQSNIENCASVHIMDVIPRRDSQYVFVSGTYQAGTYVVNFTDPANAQTLAWSDPEPLGATLITGGAWATYWYNGYAYETEITKGLHIMGVDHPKATTEVRLPFHNPQTVYELQNRGKCFGLRATIVGTPGDDVIVGTPGPDVILGLGGNDTIKGMGGDDRICGGPGRDKIIGGDGDDRLSGGGGADNLIGNRGDDDLYGNGGRDRCAGGRGDNIAVGCEIVFKAKSA